MFLYSLGCVSQDFQFILKGVAHLLSNPLVQTYLPNSAKKIQFHQELLVLFWKLCDFNKVKLNYHCVGRETDITNQCWKQEVGIGMGEGLGDLGIQRVSGEHRACAPRWVFLD